MSDKMTAWHTFEIRDAEKVIYRKSSESLIYFNKEDEEEDE